MATLNVNGKPHQVDVEPDTPLLYVLRDNLGLHGPKFGCGLAQCGSCNVLIDGKAVRSCTYAVGKVGPGKIVTLEGLARRPPSSRPGRAILPSGRFVRRSRTISAAAGRTRASSPP